MKVFSCSDNCCQYQTFYYIRRKNIFCDVKRGSPPFDRGGSPLGRGGSAPKAESRFARGRMKKSGIFITTRFSIDNIEDTKTVKILLVQSKGQFWGPPKGSLNPGESIGEAAVREVNEETGLEFDQKNIGDVKIVKGSCYYFHISMDEIPVKIQNTIEGNDANGIGWFKADCLDRLIREGKIQINQHCNILVKKITGISLPQNVQGPRPAKINFVKI